MHRTRQYLLAQLGHLAFVEEPPAQEGGGEGTPPEGASNKAPADDEGDDGDDESDFEALPAWARKEIKSLRKGEAKYRTANNELREQLKDAKSQADIDAAVAAHQQRNAELEVELAMTKHTSGFTPEQKALVSGTTAEEIEDSANKVRAAFSALPGGSLNDPGADGGLRPGGSGGNLTPRERAEAVRQRLGRRR